MGDAAALAAFSSAGLCAVVAACRKAKSSASRSLLCERSTLNCTFTREFLRSKIEAFDASIVFSVWHSRLVSTEKFFGFSPDGFNTMFAYDTFMTIQTEL